MKRDPIAMRNIAPSSIFIQTQVHEDSIYRHFHFCLTGRPLIFVTNTYVI
jgi:hypothetical protein